MEYPEALSGATPGRISRCCRIRAKIVSDRGLEYTNPFTLQYVAGHDNINTTMRHIHPREAAVHKLFARLADLQQPEQRIACKKSVQNPAVGDALKTPT
jgi:hypothetical protein